jgi:erythromycin 3''-O-methyltransferase
LWAEEYPEATFCAIGNSSAQLQQARDLMLQHGLSERVWLIQCDAVACPFAADSFDRILALESGFHFDTRQRFFRHAWELLRPGGRMVLADFIARPSINPARRLAREVGSVAWQIPRVNLCSLVQYQDQLEASGFREVTVENITEQVIEPFSRFIRDRYRQADYRRSSQPLVRTAARIMTGLGFLESLDYVIASASKPFSA